MLCFCGENMYNCLILQRKKDCFFNLKIQGYFELFVKCNFSSGSSVSRRTGLGHGTMPNPKNCQVEIWPQRPSNFAATNTKHAGGRGGVSVGNVWHIPGGFDFGPYLADD